MTERCTCRRGKIPGILPGGLLTTSWRRWAREDIPGISFGGGGSRVGACVSVGKLLEFKVSQVTLNGAREGLETANVINIFLPRDRPVMRSTRILLDNERSPYGEADPSAQSLYAHFDPVCIAAPNETVDGSKVRYL